MTPEEFAVAQVKILKNCLFFTRYFFKKIHGKKFVVGDHHHIIGDALDRVLRGECTRLIINVCPRYTKTEMAVKNFIAKGLGLNPKAKFIHLSYSKSLALDNSEAIKDIVKHEDYKLMFPDVKIKKGTDAKEKWYTADGGGVYATATGGQITGFGAGLVDEEELDDIDDDWFAQSESFGGAIIIDDPIKPEDAHSEKIRTMVNERFDSTIANRVNSRKTPIIVIMQRLHPNDLCGHLMEKYKGFEVISLPVIKADGQPLWPHKHTLAELQDMRLANEFVFDTQYMQDPRPKYGQLFPNDELKYFKPDDALVFESEIGYCDVADEGDDWTSLPIAKNIGANIYITDVLFNDANSDVTIPLAAALITKNNLKYCRVESNAMGAMFARNLQKLLKICKIYQAVSTSNKHVRILMDAGFIKQYFHFVHPDFQSPEYKKFMQQLIGYLKDGSSKHDDAADSLSGLAIFIRSLLGKYYQ